MTNITNEKYVLLKESLKAIKNEDLNILTLTGSSGSGKTFTTLKHLKEKEMNYVYINSYATPLSFYELLYENRKKGVIVFDDLMGVSNPLVLSMLKAACWISNQKRIVSYHSTSDKMDKLKLPSSFEFKANVILIFNKLIPGYEPITNRGIKIDFNFDFKQKMEIFKEIKEDAKIEEEVLNYVKINCNDATSNLSIRTLVILSKLTRSKQDFKLFAREILKQDEGKRLLIEMDCKEWVTSTGMSRRTYFRHKHKFGLKEKSATVPQCQEEEGLK